MTDFGVKSVSVKSVSGKNCRLLLAEGYNFFSLIFRTYVILSFVPKIGQMLKLPYKIMKN